MMRPHSSTDARKLFVHDNDFGAVAKEIMRTRGEVAPKNFHETGEGFSYDQLCFITSFAALSDYIS
jgi:hypothetical protein